MSDTDAASARSMRSMRSAYGRAASACACARRSFDAATIFMAEVIFCVDFTLLMRVRSAFRLGMALHLARCAGEVDARQRIGRGRGECTQCTLTRAAGATRPLPRSGRGVLRMAHAHQLK